MERRPDYQFDVRPLLLLALAGLVALAVADRLRNRDRTGPNGADGSEPAASDRPATAAGGDGEPVVEHAEPPAPDWAYDVINPVMERLLRSPLHGVVSDSLMLLTFTGRRTGREYTTPVGYQQEDDRLFVVTHSDWWKNLRGGQPVRVFLRGEEREGVAKPTSDPGAVADYAHEVLEREGTEHATRRLGLRIHGDGIPDRDALEDAVRSTVVIEIELRE